MTSSGGLEPAFTLSVRVKDLPNSVAGNAYIKYQLKSFRYNGKRHTLFTSSYLLSELLSSPQQKKGIGYTNYNYIISPT